MRFLKLLLFCAVALVPVLSAQAQLPQTRGQKLLSDDLNLKLRDGDAIHKGIVPDDGSAKLILANDDMMIAWDAQILDAELSHIEIVKYNAEHSEHQYADVNETLDMLVDARQKILVKVKAARRALKWPVQ